MRDNFWFGAYMYNSCTLRHITKQIFRKVLNETLYQSAANNITFDPANGVALAKRFLGKRFPTRIGSMYIEPYGEKSEDVTLANLNTSTNSSRLQVQNKISTTNG